MSMTRLDDDEKGLRGEDEIIEGDGPFEKISLEEEKEKGGGEIERLDMDSNLVASITSPIPTNNIKDVREDEPRTTNDRTSVRSAGCGRRFSQGLCDYLVVIMVPFSLTSYTVNLSPPVDTLVKGIIPPGIGMVSKVSQALTGKENPCASMRALGKGSFIKGLAVVLVFEFGGGIGGVLASYALDKMVIKLSPILSGSTHRIVQIIGFVLITDAFKIPAYGTASYLTYIGTNNIGLRLWSYMIGKQEELVMAAPNSKWYQHFGQYVVNFVVIFAQGVELTETALFYLNIANLAAGQQPILTKLSKDPIYLFMMSNVITKCMRYFIFTPHKSNVLRRREEPEGGYPQGRLARDSELQQQQNDQPSNLQKAKQLVLNVVLGGVVPVATLYSMYQMTCALTPYCEDNTQSNRLKCYLFSIIIPSVIDQFGPQIVRGMGSSMEIVSKCWSSLFHYTTNKALSETDSLIQNDDKQAKSLAKRGW